MKKLLLILLCCVFTLSCNNNRDNPFNGVIDNTIIGEGCNYGASVAEAVEICDLYRGNNFNSNKSADIALSKILSVTGMSKRFVLQECTNISNCVATSYKGIRYILYDPEFMNIIATHTNPWSRLAILAHEVGHHVNGHSLDLIVYSTKSAEPPTLSESRQMELEADEYSGFVMYKLGASLKQAQEAINLMTTNDDDAYSTHPSKDKRLLAIAKGYNDAKAQSPNNSSKSKEDQIITHNKEINESKMTAEDYFYLAKSKIQNSSKIAWLLERERPIFAASKKVLSEGVYAEFPKDYMEQIGDLRGLYQKAIKTNPNHVEALIEAGIFEYLYFGYDASFLTTSIQYFSRAIELDPTNVDAYYHRYVTFIHLGNEKRAIKDLKTLIKLKPEYSFEWYYQISGIFYNFLDAVSYQKAIEYTTLGIKLLNNSELELTESSRNDFLGKLYSMRASSKKALGQSYCNDLKKSCDSGWMQYVCTEYFKDCP